MVSIPILSGIEASNTDFVTAWPLNLVPVPKPTGISEGYLRPSEGIELLGMGPGANRGGYRWRDVHYRVMGSKLLSVDAAGGTTEIGTIAGSDWCTFTESFDYMAINGGGKLYLYNGTLLQQVTDPDLGNSLDVEWINGYFISTDGQSLVSSDINDPFSFNILRYASSEISPDPVVGLFELRNELYAINRYTVEVFGALAAPGDGFPFARIEGAQIMKGAVGARAVCEFVQSLAFVGSGDSEPLSVWLGRSGSAVKLSTRDIDRVLKGYSDTVLANIVMEARSDEGHEFLYVHLPDQTLVYDAAASEETESRVWFALNSGDGYRARGFVWCYGQWNVADPFGTSIGKLSLDTGAHYGAHVPWEFSTPIAYNEGRGAIVHELELVAITGSLALGDAPMIGTSYTLDGETYSQVRWISAGKVGERGKRLVWRRMGTMKNWRAHRFYGDSRARLAFARLEAQVEGLAV